MTVSDTEAERLTAAVLAYQWVPRRAYTAHANHSYYYACAVCAKDVAAIVGAVQEAQRDTPHLTPTTPTTRS